MPRKLGTIAPLILATLPATASGRGLLVQAQVRDGACGVLLGERWVAQGDWSALLAGWRDRRRVEIGLGSERETIDCASAFDHAAGAAGFRHVILRVQPRALL